jgi:succinate-semialdehyde dehydrogenase/glutarate-semialdehyde dehydrogenase
VERIEHVDDKPEPPPESATEAQAEDEDGAPPGPSEPEAAASAASATSAASAADVQQALCPPEPLGPSLLPFVDGEPTGGEGPELRCVNPSTGEAYARVACVSVSEIDLAVESAILASAMWRGTPFEERRRKLHGLADVVLAQAETLAELICTEQGKPVVEAMQLEILPALDHLRYLADHAREAFTGEPVQPTRPMFGHKQAHYMYEPVGIVAIVTPYNLPFALPLVQVGAALAMGNAVLLKPSERTPICGLRIGELCAEAGLPSGVVNVLPTAREDALYLVSHPRVDKVFLTGTEDTGQQVMATAGCMPKPVVLGLGGKHPTVVAADADLDRAARGIVWGALANAGQNCGSVERVYVEQPIAQRFVDKVLECVDGLGLGDPHEPGTDVGPLITHEHRDHVHRQVTEAVLSGARLLRGGEIPDGPGFFYPPTVLYGPPTDSWLLREETLGPVIPIVVVENVERAVLLANDTMYAQTASGWTRSPQTAERLMSSLQASVVTINDVLYSFGEPAATKSGYRMSGLGHAHGIAGLREMCRRRFVSFDPLPAEAPLAAFPYDDTAERIATALRRRLHAPGRTTRLAAWFRLFATKRFRARVPRRFFLHKVRRRKKR